MQNSLSQVQVQKQTQEQLQLQSAIQVMSAKLTELPLDAFRERLQNELAENPYLDATQSQETQTCSSVLDGQSAGQDYDVRNDYTTEDDIPDYLLNQNNGTTETTEIEAADTQSFYDQLMEQVGEYDLNEHDRQVLEYIIGNLGDDGLLAKPLAQIADELTIYHYIDTTTEDAERMLHVLWQFEPSGIGARSLQECLIIQCRRSGHSEEDLILKVLTQSWELIVHNNWHKIQLQYNLSDLELEQLRQEIRKLNPRPGSSMGEKNNDAEDTVTPDFIIEIDTDSQIHLSLNETDIPTLTISDDAMEMISEDFVKTYVSRGKLFINAIQQRRQTMLKTMTAIIRLQRKFFLDGDEKSLRPMRLEDIADITHQNLSTISRVCNNKYAETPYGTFRLKWFFSNAISANEDNSQYAISTRQIKTALKEIIKTEDKNSPYSDDVLTEKLNKQGYLIARRTVAKYREQLSIPTSRMRK